MNLELDINRHYSKAHAESIVRQIGDDAELFKQLVKLLFSTDKNTAMRASWILSMCAEKYPQLIFPHLSKIISRTEEPTVSGSVKRNVVRSLQFIEIPKRFQGRVVNLCFSFLQNQKEEIAVKAFSMTVLANIARQQPELKNEIRLVIEEILPYGSAGVVSRGKKVLKQLLNN